MTGLHLTRTEENVAEIDALVAQLADHGGGRVGVEGVLADLPRRMRRTFAPHPRLLGRKVSRALTWDAADRRDPSWWPQGISSSVRTSVTRDVLAVSWYAKNDHGSRISFVDLERRRYQHVLLAEPTMTDGRAGLKPLKVHAGGIVWHGPYLHVAATGRGFFTCRLDDLLEVPTGVSFSPLVEVSRDARGRAPRQPGGGRHETRYVLPVRFAYKARSDEGVERLRYSFLTLDRSTEPPSLVAGEYGSAQQTRRLARIPTDPETGLLATDQDGFSRPTVDERGEVRMQGAAVAKGVYYLTASQGHWNPGTVHVGTPGDFRAVRWATPPGPEDLVWWPATDLLWSVTEHPRRRWIFAMRRGSFDSR